MEIVLYVYLASFILCLLTRNIFIENDYLLSSSGSKDVKGMLIENERAGRDPELVPSPLECFNQREIVNRCPLPQQS